MHRWSDSHQNEEFKELVSGVGVRIVAGLTVKREKVDPKYYVGVGKVTEIRTLIETHKATLVCFGNDCWFVFYAYFCIYIL